MGRRVREAMRRMRRDLHQEMSVPAYYIAATGSQPKLCSVRVHDIPAANGKPAGSQAGLAQQADLKPQLIFYAADAPTMIRVAAVVSVEPGEAYRISFVHPPHGVTIAADVARLSAGEAAGLPVP